MLQVVSSRIPTIRKEIKTNLSPTIEIVTSRVPTIRKEIRTNLSITIDFFFFVFGEP